MKKLTLIIFLALFLNCNTKKKTDLKVENKIETKYVTAKSGLNYRKKPKKEVLGKFEYGKKLKIIEHTNLFESITDNHETIKDEWLGVKINNDTVYVFGGYLAKEKPIIELKKKTSPYEILLPTTYRSWNNENPVNYLNKQWLAISKNNSKYFIDKVNYRIENGISECTGDSTKTIITKKETLLLIKNATINYGEIYSHKIDKNRIWPQEKTTYKYNNIEYQIRAEGEFTDPENALVKKDSKFYADVKNYKLYISTNANNESLILEEKSFNDTFVKILFIGDIDSDGRLDFIFEANRHYEEERVILFLSSITTKNKVIKKAAETVIQFDC